MALLDSTKKEKTSAPSRFKQVRPVVVRTQNVAKELQAIAIFYKIKVDTLDFNVFEVQTFTRMKDGDKETEWELVPEDELCELDEESALLNPNFQIKQTYEIEIFAANSKKEKYPEFKVAVGANSTKCKVYLSILAGSKISYSDGLEDYLRETIRKRKIRAGILIDIFDEMLDDTISKITATIRIQEKITYVKNQTVLIAQSYEPTPTVNDEFILYYDKKEEVDENSKMDYASRSFIESAIEGELLMEYKKAKEGTSGRNCCGEYMLPSEPVIAHAPTFVFDDTITIDETDTSIKYTAAVNGYIALEGSTYTIKSDMDVGEISFKTTGSINAGLDSGVTISIKKSDTDKDAIGNGMSVEVTEIDIDGNVGSNATITAIKASIGGQTHKTATIRAEKLDINVHKGVAYGKNIHITSLEQGEVNGDKVKIIQAMGGVIKAKEIDIEICTSYVKATATKRIEIQKMLGSENIFTIDPLLSSDIKEGLGENQKEISKLKESVKTLEKEIEKYTTLIKDGTAAFIDIKKRLMKYKKNGVKLPASFVAKYKQFQDMQVNLKEMKIEYEVKMEKLTLLTTHTSSFQEDIFDARVINRDRWVGFNEIKFRLVKPAIELVYKPKEGSSDKIFGLVKTEEGEFEIQPLDE